MYKLKQIPSDFIVDEIADFEVESLNQKSGKYIYLKLNKENWNTISVVREMAKLLGIDAKDINFAGTKDKNAITSQFVSIKTSGRNLLDKLPLNLPKGISLRFVGFADSPLSLGKLLGNKFGITVRGLDANESFIDRKFFVNYFDEQRFSTSNVAIGRAIIKKDFKKAAELINDFKVQGQLKDSPNQPLKALLKLPRKLLMLYIHAYQSYLWNETVSEYLSIKYGENLPIINYSQGKLIICSDSQLTDLVDFQIPLVGALPLSNTLNSEIKKIVETLMYKENIDRYDFVIRQLPNMTPEGGMRDVVAKIQNLSVGEKEVDELNKELMKMTVSFELGRGSYATMLVKFLLDNKNVD
ncbi:tRNA pseudouridine(13) synthase TruD [archaeon]|nr:tRNA pseudouridine(13) synthase TruD [archaeon]MBT6761642.1 tRNA pseudouridine(13) synthase TruD [archaeon]